MSETASPSPYPTTVNHNAYISSGGGGAVSAQLPLACGASRAAGIGTGLLDGEGCWSQYVCHTRRKCPSTCSTYLAPEMCSRMREKSSVERGSVCKTGHQNMHKIWNYFFARNVKYTKRAWQMRTKSDNFVQNLRSTYYPHQQRSATRQKHLKTRKYFALSPPPNQYGVSAGLGDQLSGRDPQKRVVFFLLLLWPRNERKKIHIKLPTFSEKGEIYLLINIIYNNKYLYYLQNNYLFIYLLLVNMFVFCLFVL